MTFVSKRRNNSYAATTFAKDQSKGTYVFKPGINEVRLAWTGGYTLLRLLPVLNPEDENYGFDSLFLGDGNFGEALYFAYAASGVGEDSKATFLLSPSYDEQVDFRCNPYCILRDYVVNGAREDTLPDPTWKRFIESGAKGSAMPAYDKQLLYLQCICFTNGDKDYNLEDSFRSLNVARLTASAAKAFKNLILDEYSKNPSFDITHIKDGKFITFWNGTKPNPYTRASSNQGFPCYSLQIDDTYPGLGAYHGMSADLTDHEQQVRKTIRPWSEVFSFYSYEDQARILCDAFSKTPQLLLAAFSGNPTWLSEQVRNSADSRLVSQTIHPAVVAPVEEDYQEFNPMENSVPFN